MQVGQGGEQAVHVLLGGLETGDEAHHGMAPVIGAPVLVIAHRVELGLEGVVHHGDTWLVGESTHSVHPLALSPSWRRAAISLAWRAMWK